MRAIFLDRDGVICRNRPDHVKNWNEFVFVARAREALTRLAALDIPIIIVTNQAVINRKIIPAEAVDEIHRHMIINIEAAGGRIDRVYYCPHRPNERCACRKPQPGMLQQAAADMGIQLKGSYLVGDAWSDIQAGMAVDCTPFLVLTGRGLSQAPQALREGPGCFRVVRDLYEAATVILHTEGATVHPEARSWSDRFSTKPLHNQGLSLPQQPLAQRTR